MNVRHPLSRLVSAWRDKFRRTPSGISYWMRKYGKFINAKFGNEGYQIPEDFEVDIDKAFNILSKNGIEKV